MSAVVLLMFCVFPASALAAANDQAVRNTVLAFSTDWNRHDMVAFGELFAPDADFVNVAGAHWESRQQIQMSHAWAHGTIPESTQPVGANRAHYGIFKHSIMKFTHVSIRFLRTDVAVAHVNWELRGDSRTPTPRRGILTFVLTHENGSWLITAAQNTEIQRTVH